MEEETTYYASVEFKFLPGSDGYGELLGGFVYAFVKAHEVRDALPRILAELKSMSLGILSVEFVCIYEDIPWETVKDTQHYDSLAKEAWETDQVVLDMFYAYDRE